MGKPRNCMLVKHNQKYVKHMLFKNAKLDLFFINAWAATDFIWIKTSSDLFFCALVTSGCFQLDILEKSWIMSANVAGFALKLTQRWLQNKILQTSILCRVNDQLQVVQNSTGRRCRDKSVHLDMCLMVHDQTKCEDPDYCNTCWPLSAGTLLCNYNRKIIFTADWVLEISPGYKFSTAGTSKEKVRGSMKWKSVLCDWWSKKW